LSSFVLPWTNIKSYLAKVGPEVGRPPRPTACLRCCSSRIWYDGWRRVFCVLLGEDGRPERLDEGVPLQRVACARCWVSWTLYPAFLYPCRQFAPDVNEAAALAYLADAHATYVKVGSRYGCSWTSVWRWVGRLGLLVTPEETLAAMLRLDRDSPAPELVPRRVPQDHEKAYSPERAQVLLQAYRTIVLVCFLARGMSVPPLDPSPLRWFLWTAFLVFPLPIRLEGEVRSPAFHIDRRGPPKA